MPLNFSPQELSRYSRQLLLPGVGVEGQAKLRDARVLLIGLGGLGSPAALYLAAAGVGTLGLADPDQLELHNLHRQVLHDTIHLGTPKTISARERLAALNPEIRLREHIDGFSAANARTLAEEYDLIVDGADNFPTRYLANDVAVQARRPLVHGSIMRFEGQVAVFAPARGGPCYRCLFPEMPAPGEVPDCSEAGVFGALCGLIGSLMAMEALKLILNAGEPLIGRMLVYEALGATPRAIRLKADPRCPACGPQPEPRIAALEPSLYQWQCETRPARRRSSDTNERFLRDLHALRGTKVNEPKTNEAKSRDTNENFLRDMQALRGAHAQPSRTPPTPSPMSSLSFDPASPPLEIGVDEAHTWLESAAPPLVLDVREPFEVSLCRLNGSTTIPLAEVPARLADLPRDRPILVHCHHGGRSLQAAKFLRAKGFSQAVNLRGGIHQWAEEIEPGMAKY